MVATKLINKHCEGKEITIQDVEEVYHKKFGASKEEIFEACQGFITEYHIYMIGILRQEITHSEQTIESLDQRIKQILQSYDNVLELLKKVPGISSKNVEDLVSEIGLDMGVFPGEKTGILDWHVPRQQRKCGQKKRKDHTGK